MAVPTTQVRTLSPSSMTKATRPLSGHQALSAALDHRGKGVEVMNPREEGPGKKAECKGDAGRDLTPGLF